MATKKSPQDSKSIIIDTEQDKNDVQSAMDKLKGSSQNEQINTQMLRSRIEEQVSLISTLKQQADEMLLRCRALEQINSELESLVADERERFKHLEQRFTDLVANHKEMIKFKDEYKQHNNELIKENKRLKEENERLFSKELQEKEKTIEKLTQDFILITEHCRALEKEQQEKTSGFEIMIQQLMDCHKINEATLKDELQSTQKQLKATLQLSAEIDNKLKQMQDKYRIKETEANEKLQKLLKEKGQVLELSVEREKIIQDKQKEIDELEKKKQEEENARHLAEDRFKKEEAAVNTELRVKMCQYELQKAEEKYNNLTKDFEAFKKHSSDLLTQEKKMNAKLLWWEKMNL